jgi:hypothetical protein
MKILILKYTLTLLLLISFASCKKILDVNDNPNKATTATLVGLLPATIEATANNHFTTANSTCLFAQQLASYPGGQLSNDQNRNVRLGTPFFSIYSNTLNNVVFMINLAQQQQAPYYEGMGKILLALNLGLATDVFGNIPYSEAFKGVENLKPKYDTQQDIYTAIQALLSEGVILLSKPSGTLKPATDDLCYAGNSGKWIKLANVLKARYALHLTKKGAVAAANQALGYLAGGFAGNADDFQLTYTSRNINPWNKNVAIGTGTGNFTITHSRKFLDGMNGVTYPGLIDPRLPFIADKGTSTLNFTGIINGSGISGNTNITANTFFAKDVSPVIMVSYAEQKLIEAEANFLANGGTVSSTGSTAAAYNAYLVAIGANMDKLGVSVANKTTYLADLQVAVTATGIKLEHIMREKFIALYLNPEVWTDVRRYDYNNTVFKGIALPVNQDPLMAGQFIRRSMYPLEELTRNPNAVTEEKTLTDKLWWDQ